MSVRGNRHSGGTYYSCAISAAVFKFKFKNICRVQLHFHCQSDAKDSSFGRRKSSERSLSSNTASDVIQSAEHTFYRHNWTEFCRLTFELQINWIRFRFCRIMQNYSSSVSNDTVFCMRNACPLQIDMHSLTFHGKLADFRIFVAVRSMIQTI